MTVPTALSLRPVTRLVDYRDVCPESRHLRRNPGCPPWGGQQRTSESSAAATDRGIGEHRTLTPTKPVDLIRLSVSLLLSCCFLPARHANASPRSEHAASLPARARRTSRAHFQFGVVLPIC